MKNKSKRKIKFRYKLLFIVIILIVAIFLYLTKIVDPIIFSYNKSQIEQDSMSVINSTVKSSLENYLYDDLIKVEKNASGDITLIACNSSAVNKLSNEISTNCQNSLIDLGNNGINISLLTFTGITALNGVGPTVNIKTTPVGHCETAYKSKFSSCGINQTLHQLSITITAKISVLLPANSFDVNISTEVLVCESVIVGKIPQVYLNSGIFGGNMDLIP